MAAVVLPCRANVLLRYAVAIASAAAALVLRLALEPLLSFRAPLLLPTFAVMFSAWFGGLGPGLLATALCVGVWPFHGSELTDALLAGRAQAYVRLGMFAAVGAGISILCELMRRARARAERAASESQVASGALARQVAQLQTLLDLAPVGIAVAHDPQATLITANAAMSRLLGMAPDANISKMAPSPPAFRAFREGQEVPTSELAMQRAANRGEMVQDEEYEIIRPDGSRVIVCAYAAPLLDDHGNTTGSVGVWLDITHRKQVEAELNEQQQRLRELMKKAQQANQAKDQFLAALSHELRTPLTPMLINSERLEKDPAVSASTREDVRVIRQSAQVQARLLDDLLDLTRIAHGKFALQKQRTDVHARIREALNVCQADVVAKRIAVQLHLSAAEWHALADSARLEQVFWNVIRNALKFTPESGAIAIRSYNRSGIASDSVGASSATDGAVNPTPRLLVELSDNGIGIEPELLPRIFNPYEQGHAAVVDRHGGLGLGLSICRAIVEAHGGRIWAASDGPGKGSTFTVELPLAPAEATLEIQPPPQPVVSSQAPARSLRILLVEDHEHTARVIGRLLAELGHEVEIAGNVQSARGLAEKQDFDLVISDLGLPDGNGLDLMRELKQRFDLTGIALSGYGMDDDIRRSFEAGFAQHLTKPVNIGQLQQAVRRVASNE